MVAASGWRGSEKEGEERMGDALDAGISSSAEAGLVMLIDLIGGHDSTVD